jgi:glycosyltransferase involved in cell wall biosynthesis
MESVSSSQEVRYEQQIQRPKPAVCILLENYPAPFDRRVWQESRALTEAGYLVSIISPKALGLNIDEETIDGIHVYRHRTFEAKTPLGYVLEYSWALICEFKLAVKIYRRTHFRIIHACNPPDCSFLIAAFFTLFGVRFVFDHHDLCPELFEDKFGRRGFLYQLVRLFEYLTFRTADVSIATNESYREIAIQRGKMSPERVFIVRSCLDLSKVIRRQPRPELKNGKPLLVVYLGVMGPQDGVDLLLNSISSLVHDVNRRDTQFVLIGSGTETPRLKMLASQKLLDPFVKFTGRIPDGELEEYLSTADVAVAPDPANSLNDKSTMNKTLHYMAYSLPIVQYDLTEGRRSAGDAALYARNDDPKEFADLVAQLLDSESLRREMGTRGRQRIDEQLNWNIEKKELLRAYQAVLETNDRSLFNTTTISSQDQNAVAIPSQFTENLSKPDNASCGSDMEFSIDSCSTDKPSRISMSNLPI